MKDNNNDDAARYINTPFAYTKTQRGLTLLQQHIMVRVSAHIQEYVQRFFSSRELTESPERPKPIMTKDDLEAMPPIRISMDEMGVSSGTYSRVREALQKVLAVTIGVKTIADDGRPTISNLFMFSRFDIPVTDNGTTVRMKVESADDLTNVQVDRMRGYIDVYLNKDAVFAMFDMAQGYVAHPENIARIGRTDNMPLMYYFVRHSMQNFKASKSKVTPEQLRDYLGMIKRDADGNITKVQYPKWSVCKSRVVQTALDDIKRVYDAGQIDFYFDMREIRPRGKKIGEPSYLEFTKVGTSKREEANRRKNSEKKLVDTITGLYPTLDAGRLSTIIAMVPDDRWDDFKAYAYNDVPKAAERPHRWDGTHEDFVYYLMTQKAKSYQMQEQPNLFSPPADDRPGAAHWRAFVDAYTGPLKEVVSDMPFHSYDAGAKRVILRASREAESEFNKFVESMTAKQKSEFNEELARAYGQRVSLYFCG